MDSGRIDEELVGHYGRNQAPTIPPDTNITTIYYEISGNCNARCKYCATGGGSYSGCRWRYIPPDEFNQGIDRLYRLGFLHDKVDLGLFNWGEPLLNPHIGEILQNLHDLGQSFQLSTNGSRYQKLPDKYFENLTYFRFSLHGFSQDSFQRINHLKFDSVLENIEKWLEVVPRKAVEICFFLYRFNHTDMVKAYEYFLNRDVRFTVNMPSINDFNRAFEYLTGNLDESSRAEVDRDLLTDNIPLFLRTKPHGFVCPLLTSQITIDEFHNILTCCLISKKSRYYSFGSLFDLSREEILRKKANSPVCNGCMQVGVPYWLMKSSELLPNFIIQQNYTSRSHGISSLYVNTGEGFSEKEKETADIRRIGERFSVEFDLTRYSGISEIRFDPIEYHLCTLQLDTISLVGPDTSLAKCGNLSQYRVNGDWISENTIEFNTLDPWIIIPVPDAGIKGVYIEGKLRLR